MKVKKNPSAIAVYKSLKLKKSAGIEKISKKPKKKEQKKSMETKAKIMMNDRYFSKEDWKDVTYSGWARKGNPVKQKVDPEVLKKIIEDRKKKSLRIKAVLKSKGYGQLIKKKGNYTKKNVQMKENLEQQKVSPQSSKMQNGRTNVTNGKSKINLKKTTKKFETKKIIPVEQPLNGAASPKTNTEKIVTEKKFPNKSQLKKESGLSSKSKLNGDSHMQLDEMKVEVKKGASRLQKKQHDMSLKKKLCVSKAEKRKIESEEESDMAIVNRDDQHLHKKVSSTKKQLKDNSQKGLAELQWMLQSCNPQVFFSQYWEKKALLIKNKSDTNPYQDILSTDIIQQILEEDSVFFTKNLDVTSYVNGKRETHNPEGRAYPALVWDFYNTGCSVRMLNPQTFHTPVWQLLEGLQEYFGSFCGANVYLTPPGTQGFAPHWDDIEAFVLQLEGKKHWRVYNPRAKKELPRYSSGNFNDKSDLGEPVIDCILEAGDLLYFPRGFIHQANALEDQHSLHITVSTYQKSSYADLLEKLVPAALAKACENDLEFRRGLPIGYLTSMGSGISKNPGKKLSPEVEIAKIVESKVSDLVHRLVKYLPLKEAVDGMAKDFIADALPPVVTTNEEERSVFGGGEWWSSEVNGVVNRVEMAPDTRIRIIREKCLRLINEEDETRLYFSINNSREYHERDPSFIVMDESSANVVKKLIKDYPTFTSIENLPAGDLETQITLASALWEKGLIVTKKPLESVEY